MGLGSWFGISWEVTRKRMARGRGNCTLSMEARLSLGPCQGARGCGRPRPMPYGSVNVAHLHGPACHCSTGHLSWKTAHEAELVASGLRLCLARPPLFWPWTAPFTP